MNIAGKKRAQPAFCLDLDGICHPFQDVLWFIYRSPRVGTGAAFPIFAAIESFRRIVFFSSGFIFAIRRKTEEIKS
jgi:hypothetical protein